MRRTHGLGVGRMGAAILRLKGNGWVSSLPCLSNSTKSVRTCQQSPNPVVFGSTSCAASISSAEITDAATWDSYSHLGVVLAIKKAMTGAHEYRSGGHCLFGMTCGILCGRSQGPAHGDSGKASPTVEIASAPDGSARDLWESCADSKSPLITQALSAGSLLQASFENLLVEVHGDDPIRRIHNL